jgi:hypothetical protein
MVGYVPVGKIGKEAIQVTLLGPSLTDQTQWRHAFRDFTLWCDATLLQWTLWCKENQPCGNWTWSRDTGNDRFRLHVWFQSATDACVFKLMTADYC